MRRSESPGALIKAQIAGPTRRVSDVKESAFLTSSQKTLMLLVKGPHFKKHRPKWLLLFVVVQEPGLDHAKPGIPLAMVMGVGKLLTWFLGLLRGRTKMPGLQKLSAHSCWCHLTRLTLHLCWEPPLSPRELDFGMTSVLRMSE